MTLQVRCSMVAGLGAGLIGNDSGSNMASISEGRIAIAYVSTVLGAARLPLSPFHNHLSAATSLTTAGDGRQGNMGTRDHVEFRG